jgi:hypothetical protein
VKTPKNAVVQKIHSFIMMCLQKKLNILLLKYGITEELEKRNPEVVDNLPMDTD